jgi:hypothetical protein
MIKEWIKNLVRDALQETLRKERIATSFNVMAERGPNGQDYNYPIGALWQCGEKQFTLERIEAFWEPVKEDE